MCGIFGIANHPDAARMTYLGLYALQHRGQESCGISSSDGEQVFTHKAMGHVADVFTEDVFKKLSGERAIGHTRPAVGAGVRLPFFSGDLLEDLELQVAVGYQLFEPPVFLL